jgi:predicted nucleic acid-binding protein
MNFFLLDGSALVKRFAPEPGTALVDHLFTQASRDQLTCLMIGAAETAATLVRKRNQGVLTPAIFAAAATELSAEVVFATGFFKFASDNVTITRSIPLSEKHAINATDAIVLQTALQSAAQLRPAGNDLVLVACDYRLLRAAQAERLLTFDPENQTQAELDALLGA